MQMTDFGSAADLYPQSAANNWYQSQFTTIGNSFPGLNSSNLTNLSASPGHHHHQLNSLNQLHHHSSSDNVTNAILHNSPPNSTSPLQTTAHQPNSGGGGGGGGGSSQLTNLTPANGLPSLTATQTTQSNHTAQHLLSLAQTQQSRSNATSLNLSTNSNSTSTNGSNNALTSYSSQLGSNSSGSTAASATHLHHPAHQFNIPSHLSAVNSATAQHPTHHSQFSAHPLGHHSAHQHHTLNHLNPHHHFFGVPNNFFPVHNAANASATGSTGASAFTTPPSPSSPNNTSINSTTNAFNSLTFHRSDSASNTSGNSSSTMNAVAAMAAMTRASGLSPTESTNHHQLNGSTGYDRMHPSYSSYPSLIDHHHSSRTPGLDSFVGLRHMPSLANLASNCNATGNNGLNNLDDSNVNSMFIAHHNQSLNQSNLMAGHLNPISSNSANQNLAAGLVPLHGSTHHHNNSVNSSSDSREDDMTVNCLNSIKQEDDDDKLTTLTSNQYTTGSGLDHHHPMPYSWVKKTSHSSQAQAGKTRTRDKYRVVYTDHQRMELEKEFLFSKYITIRRKSELAQQLNLSERQVKIWFQNRRAKGRKVLKKESGGDVKSNQIVVNHI